MKISGKQFSLGAKALAIIYVITATILGAIFKWDTPVADHIKVGIFIAGTGLPVDASMITKNIRGTSG